MPVEVKIETHATALAHDLGDVTGKQFPFGAALALARIAAVGRRAVKSEMARLFTLRNKFSATSVQVNRAEKGDWPDVKAEIGIEQRRSYLLDHITGATRKPQNPRALAIPLLDRLRGPSVRVLKTQRPQALLANGAYRIEGRNGPLLTQKRNGTAVPVYAFERSAKIKAVLPFEEIVSRAAWTAYSRELRKAFEQAIQPPK